MGFKIAGITIASHLSKLLVTLFIIKQISIIHGPQGLGFLGNFMSLVSIASSLAGGGVVSGIIKYLAEYSGFLGRQQHFIGSALLYTCLFAFLTLVVGFFFVDSITDSVFSNQHYRDYIYFFLIAQLIVSLNNFSFGVANGLGKNKIYAISMLFGNLIAIIVAYYCIQHYGMWGSIVAIMSPVVFPFIPACFYTFSQRLMKYIRFDSFFHDSRLLAKFSIMLLGSTICFPLVEIIVRNQIIVSLGYESAGFWQAITKLSSAYLSFYSLFLTFYFLPLISSLFNKTMIMREVNKMMLILGSSFFIMLSLFFFFKDIIIRGLLSDEFLPISDLLMLQMVGDGFRVLGWVIGFVVVAKAATTLYLLGELFQGAVFVIISHFALASYHELRGIVLAYVTTCFLYFMLSVVLFFCFYVKKSARLGVLKIMLPKKT